MHKNPRIERLIPPTALQTDEQLVWSYGKGNDFWALCCAAMNNDVEEAKRLLQFDPGLVRSSWQYRPALSFAVQENSLEVASLLLSYGANPVESGTSDTLLTIAFDRGFTDMQTLLSSAVATVRPGIPGGELIAESIKDKNLPLVKKLLTENPALAQAADAHTNLPIHWATMTRQLDMIDLILSFGADINVKRFDGARAVQLINGDYNYRGWTKEFPITPLEVLAHLRKRGAEIDLSTACATGDIDMVREILDRDPSGANKVSDYVSYYVGSGAPIKNAAARGHLEIVKLLLDRGADPNLPEEGIAPHGHALYSAVYNGHTEIIKLLLEHGAYPNVEVESSADTLSIALSKKDQAIVNLLCSYGASSNMHLLAYNGDTRTAAAVLAANPALADDVSALENAAGEGHEDFVRLLLLYKPDLPKRIAVGVNARSPGDPAKTEEITGLLFKHGMDANYPNWLLKRPLHRFAERGDVKNATIFLEHGADIEAIDEDILSTPLGHAAKAGRVDMVSFLLKKGAKAQPVGVPDWSTPLQWSIKRNHPDIERLLIENGAVK